MRSILSLLVLVCVCVVGLSAQAPEKPEPRVIQVSGSAEQMVTPDEFIFKITLAERIEKKEKVTIEAQEAALRDELQKIGINSAKDLSIYDISAAYFRHKKVKDVLATKNYRLVVRDLTKIIPLQDLADRLNVSKLDLVDTKNSRMTEIRREVKIEAIKAAKAKAEYLLSAIGEKLGKAISVSEGSERTENSWIIDGQEVSNFRSGALNSNSNLPSTARSTSDEPSIGFAATKVRFEITVKFEIQ